MFSSKLEKRSTYSSFSTEEGNDEYFLVLKTAPTSHFKKSLEEIRLNFNSALAKLSLPLSSLVFSRFYVSDIANQRDLLLKSKIYSECITGALSVIQQAPLDTSYLTLFNYFVLPGKKRSCRKKHLSLSKDRWRNGVELTGKNYSMLYTGNFSGEGVLDSAAQTREIFDSYTSLLERKSMNLLDNCLRTWIYVRDIDNHYQGMVDARREFFQKAGLTSTTRYIASTGIEGKSRLVNTLVSMDALSWSGIKKEQIIRMEALKNLCPTINYNVTFERGTRIVFGDRSHMHISGTASIDSHGNILHECDTIKQTRRTLENIRALLEAQSADLSDMAYLIVYLRDPSSYDAVLDVIWEEVSRTIPVIAVAGSVCRPGWLVEIEGIA
ncbi:MAG: hypothetical protein A2096_05095, partial [Spirochaetes bacterium GWF1_41_5]